MTQTDRAGHKYSAVTLIELIVAVGLLAIVVIAASNFGIFSHHHFITTDRRSRLQNELTYALEHMSRQITIAIGSRAIIGADPVRFDNIQGRPAIEIFIDSNAAGAPDGQGNPQAPTQNDRWVGYRFTATNELRFYPDCGSNQNPVCAGRRNNLIARNIRRPAAGDLGVAGNAINITLGAVWDATSAVSVDNPEVIMRTSVTMPSVSAN